MNEWEWNLLEDKAPLTSVTIRGGDVKAGDLVRLRPRAGGDIMDVALAGKTAVVESLEQDYEGQVQLAVVLADDPGRDLGMMRQPGHRFFFRPEEADRLPRVLVAGVGNIFCGDDAFGVEVARRLSAGPLPASVRVVDFGIRGFDLACALLDGYDLTILVDACPRGKAPGTVYLIQPDLEDPGNGDGSPGVEPHGLDPVSVIRMARTMQGELKDVLLVGCEPESLGDDDGQMGLSASVTAAVDEAIRMIRSVVAERLRDQRLA